jgi:hypothetical protein
MKTIYTSLLILSICSSNIVHAADCGDVYAQAVSNVSIKTKHDVEYDFLWNKHCESNGELKKSSLGIDILGYGLTGENASQKSQQFCKEHLQEQLRAGDSYSFDRQTVVAAQKSFNECRALELSSVHVSHETQEPRSIVIRVDFDSSKVKLRFRSFVYDPRSAKCTTTAFSGKPEVLTPTTKEAEVGPFAVVCERIASQTTNGAMKFDRFTGALDTSFGTYSVELPTRKCWDST